MTPFAGEIQQGDLGILEIEARRHPLGAETSGGSSRRRRLPDRSRNPTHLRSRGQLARRHRRRAVAPRVLTAAYRREPPASRAGRPKVPSPRLRQTRTLPSRVSRKSCRPWPVVSTNSRSGSASDGRRKVRPADRQEFSLLGLEGRVAELKRRKLLSCLAVVPHRLNPGEQGDAARGRALHFLIQVAQVIDPTQTVDVGVGVDLDPLQPSSGCGISKPARRSEKGSGRSW